MSGLAGRRIVVTRAEKQAAPLAGLLRERGAQPLLYPCIEMLPPQQPHLLDTALHELASGAFDWLVLTSSNSAEALAERAAALGLHLPFGLSVAAVGTATAEAAQRLLNVTVDLMPDTFTGEALADAFTANGTRILLPQSALADDTLKNALTAQGSHVTAVEAYRMGVGSGGVDLPALLRANLVDAITLTSGSTAQNLLRRLKNNHRSRPPLDGVCIACIGVKTAEAAAAAGLTVTVVAAEYTLPGLVSGLEAYFGSREYAEKL
jgi:uroporphyrinogen-III synthase